MLCMSNSNVKNLRPIRIKYIAHLNIYFRSNYVSILYATNFPESYVKRATQCNSSLFSHMKYIQKTINRNQINMILLCIWSQHSHNSSWVAIAFSSLEIFISVASSSNEFVIVNRFWEVHERSTVRTSFVIRATSLVASSVRIKVCIPWFGTSTSTGGVNVL